MFERFTNQARRVVVLAQEESRMLNHNYIGTEHLILGLLHEGRGTGARALESFEITLEAARREVETRVGRGNKEPAGHIPFTPRAKKSLELSLRESLALGQKYIGTGHVLLGLLRKGDGVGVEVLVSLGADLNAVRGRVIELLADDSEREPVEGTREGSGPVRPEREPGAIHVLLDAIDARLGAIERHLGITQQVPHELLVLDQRIGKVIGEKEEAIERQDFEKAAALRDQERQLRVERERLSRKLEQASQAVGAEEASEPGVAPESRTEPEPELEVGEGTLAGGDTMTALDQHEGVVTGESTVTAEDPDQGPLTMEGPDQGPLTGGAGEDRHGGVSDEVARLRAEVARLTALLRERDIDLGKPEEPPTAAG